MVVISHRLESMIFRGLFQPKLFSDIAMRCSLREKETVKQQRRGTGAAAGGTENRDREARNGELRPGVGGRLSAVPCRARPVPPAAPAASRGPPPPCAPGARPPSSAVWGWARPRPPPPPPAAGGRSSDAEDPLEAVKKITEEMRKLTSTNWISDTDIFEDPDDFGFSGLSFGAITAIGVTVFAVIVITIILCLTCSCCCLYKACRRPRPVVTTTATTTVVHSAYPQQPAVPPSYPAGPYQGYQPVAVQPQPGMPAAPYPAQYPPPYPMQPAGPPAYHETVAAGAGAPYPTQPPYNPAYVDPQKPTY